MGQNKIWRNSSLKSPKEIVPKQKTFVLKILLLMLLIVCLLRLFYELPRSHGKIKSIFDLEFNAKKTEKCQFDKRVLRRVTFPVYGISITVDVSCPFLDRIRLFNAALDYLRLDYLQRQTGEWKNISAPGNIKVIKGAEDNFLQQLEHFPQIETVFLPWSRDKATVWNSLEDASNILISNYFEWTADEELCRWITRPNVHMYDVVFNRTCISDIQKTEKPQPLRVLALNYKPLGRGIYWPNNGTRYPSHFYIEPPPIAYYLYFIQDSIVTSYSEVWSGDMYLVPRTCSYRTKQKPPQNIDEIPLYDEVIALSQFWGEGTFHGMIEVIPRVSLCVYFLRRNPQIKVLASSRSGRLVELLAILGISKDRIISGTCRAKLLYFPRPTMCGRANLQEIQFISLLFRNYINENLKTEPRDKVILIRRSRQRKFAEHKSIERMVKETAEAHNFSFALFPDNPIPSLNKTLIMFHSAVMVIAPHGAGLSNVIFSQPGTYVIEGICNPPHTNLCFQHLSNLLGHHWHGIHSGNGCTQVVNVSISTMKATLVNHFKFMKK